jgi:hypothetical protein
MTAKFSIFFTCNFISCFELTVVTSLPTDALDHVSTLEGEEAMQAATSPPISCSCSLGINQLISCKLNQSANQLFLFSGN